MHKCTPGDVHSNCSFIKNVDRNLQNRWIFLKKCSFLSKRSQHKYTKHITFITWSHFPLSIKHTVFLCIRERIVLRLFHWQQQTHCWHMFKDILVIIYSNVSGAGLGNVSVVVQCETCQCKLVVLSHDKIINLNNGFVLVVKEKYVCQYSRSQLQKYEEKSEMGKDDNLF